MKMKRPLILFIVILLACSHPAVPQGWECQDCPKRNVALFDLDVMIENPIKDNQTYSGNRQYQDWVELFMVAGGVHQVLFNEDPGKECLVYYDGQMAMLGSIDENNYTHGNNTPSLPGPAGSLAGVDYLITGSVSGEMYNNSTIITVIVQASGTGETVATAVGSYNYAASGLQNGKNVAQQLVPLMEKIRDFEKKKRDEVDMVAIGPDGKGATLKMTPAKDKVETGKSVDFTVELIDCDGVPIKNKELRLTPAGGKFEPEQLTTDSDGKATAEFTAENTPGGFIQGFEFDFTFPYSNEKNTSGGDANITIEPLEYDARISITKRYRKTLQTSDNDLASGENRNHFIDESVDATINLYLELTETMDMPLLNQTWHYYKPISVSISSFNYSSSENKNSSGPRYTTTIDYSRKAGEHEIEEKESVTQFPWALAIDNETEQAVKIVPAGYNIAYEVNEIENMRSVVQSNQGSEVENKTTRKTMSKSFKLGPVGEKVQDPTIKRSDTWIKDYLKRQGIELPPGVPIPDVPNQEAVKEIHPDIVVSSGDGKHSFGGQGSRRIPKELDNGYQEETLSYRWQMTRRKLNK